MVVVEGEERSRLFVHDVHVHFWQTPLTRLSKRQKGRLVIILANAVPVVF